MTAEVTKDVTILLLPTHQPRPTGDRHFTPLTEKLGQLPKGVFKVFGGASIGFASHKTTAQSAEFSQMSHPALYTHLLPKHP